MENICIHFAGPDIGSPIMRNSRYVPDFRKISFSPSGNLETGAGPFGNFAIRRGFAFNNPVNIIRLLMRAIEGELIKNEQCDQNETGEPDG